MKDYQSGCGIHLTLTFMELLALVHKPAANPEHCFNHNGLTRLYCMSISFAQEVSHAGAHAGSTSMDKASRP